MSVLDVAGGGHILERKRYRPTPNTPEEKKVAFVLLIPESEIVRLQALAKSEDKTVEELLSIRVQGAGVRGGKIK